MDQDAFRTLLTSGAGSSVPRAEPHFPPKRKQKEKETAKPIFKPRKHDKPVDKYRDRATERRGGENDYAEVERVLADFEKVSTGMDSEMVEEQRKYLGGDEKHTVLVKGLDFALLEQQKAKLTSKQDVEDEKRLEEAFQNLSAPKKRTREEIVAELKKSRGEPAAPPVDTSLEVAKQSGKFRPIGAPDLKVKKRKMKDFEEGEKKKKKKRKAEAEAQESKALTTPTAKPSEEDEDTKMDATPLEHQPQRRSPSPAIDADADIFADADEWKGLGSDSESGEDVERPSDHVKPPSKAPAATESKSKANWFGEKVEEAPPEIPKRVVKEVVMTKQDEEEEEEPEQPKRLQGLASSSVPSIREILAMDDAAEKEEKRKARKEKKKDKKPSEDTRINREVKQLEKYVATKSK